jgi:hypothetical protein
MNCGGNFLRLRPFRKSPSGGSGKRTSKWVPTNQSATFDRQLYAGKGFDNLVSSGLKTHEAELSWMTALLLQFKKGKTPPVSTESDSKSAAAVLHTQASSSLLVDIEKPLFHARDSLHGYESDCITTPKWAEA